MTDNDTNSMLFHESPSLCDDCIEDCCDCEYGMRLALGLIEYNGLDEVKKDPKLAHSLQGGLERGLYTVDDINNRQRRYELNVVR